MSRSTPTGLDDVQPFRGITLKGVHKRYRTAHHDVHALRGIDLAISDPGFYGIMGPSGSGKSTLLHLMAALDGPDEGTIDINGFRLDAMSESQRTQFRREQMGIVFQQFNLLATMTALENVTMPAMLAGVGKRERLARGRELLDQLNLSDRAEHRPDALSGGQQQRVAIARALIFNPPVLYADEPTGNLDSVSSCQLWNLLSALAQERQLTVLMVTHEPEAVEHCQQIFELRDGVIEAPQESDHVDLAKPSAGTTHPQSTVGP